VLHDDRRTTTDDPFHRESNRGHLTRGDRHHRAVDRLGGSPGLVALAQFVDDHTELVGEELYRAAPDRREHARQEEHRTVSGLVPKPKLTPVNSASS